MWMYASIITEYFIDNSPTVVLLAHSLILSTHCKEHLLQFSFLVVFLLLHVLKYCSQSFKSSCQMKTWSTINATYSLTSSYILWKTNKYKILTDLTQIYRNQMHSCWREMKNIELNSLFQQTQLFQEKNAGKESLNLLRKMVLLWQQSFGICCNKWREREWKVINLNMCYIFIFFTCHLTLRFFAL